MAEPWRTGLVWSSRVLMLTGDDDNSGLNSMAILGLTYLRLMIAFKADPRLLYAA